MRDLDCSKGPRHPRRDVPAATSTGPRSTIGAALLEASGNQIDIGSQLQRITVFMMYVAYADGVPTTMGDPGSVRGSRQVPSRLLLPEIQHVLCQPNVSM
eukprot:3564118-Pyramimonas_sp.AAC.1